MSGERARERPLPAPLVAELDRLGVLPRPKPKPAPAPRPAPPDMGWFDRGEECPF
jgi:hypothetical protein